MNLLLDTSVLIDVLRYRRNRQVYLTEIVAAGHTLVTSALSIGEVYAGMRPSEEKITEVFLSCLFCHPVSRAIAQRAGEIKSKYARKGRTFALTDMVIAATAMEHGLSLLTDNRKDFALPELASVLLPKEF